MTKDIDNIIKESIEVKQNMLEDNRDEIAASVETITTALKDGGKILFFGNGGSAADSQHIAAEFVGRFQKERKALAAVALTTDSSIVTALANDYGFDCIFARQIQALGRKGDVAVGISTSGKSKNVLEGIRTAKDLGLKTVVLVGCGGGPLAEQADISIVVPSNVTARIQESHICVGHAICELVEQSF